MTRKIFKAVLVGAMLVGLMLAPLGMASADNAASGSISVIVPKTGNFVPFSLTINGQTNDNAIVDNTLGGTLTAYFDAAQWDPSHASSCPPGYTGQVITLTAKTPGASLGAVFTPNQGSPTTLGPAGDPGHNAQASVGLCVQ